MAASPITTSSSLRTGEGARRAGPVRVHRRCRYAGAWKLPSGSRPIAPHPLATPAIQRMQVPLADRLGTPATVSSRHGDSRHFPLDRGRRRTRLCPARVRRGSRTCASRKLFGAPFGDLQITQAALPTAHAMSMPRRCWSIAPPGPRTGRRARHARGGDGQAVRHRVGAAVIDRAVQLHGGLGVK